MSGSTEWRGEVGPEPAPLLVGKDQTGSGELPPPGFDLEDVRKRKRGLYGPLFWPIPAVDLTTPYAEEQQVLEGVMEIEPEAGVDPERVLEPQERGHEADLAWLSSNVEELRQVHAGRWIAIVDGEVCASATDLHELMEAVEAAAIGTPLVTFMPEQEVTWRMAYGLQGI